MDEDVTRSREVWRFDLQVRFVILSDETSIVYYYNECDRGEIPGPQRIKRIQKLVDEN